MIVLCQIRWQIIWYLKFGLSINILNLVYIQSIKVSIMSTSSVSVCIFTRLQFLKKDISYNESWKLAILLKSPSSDCVYGLGWSYLRLYEPCQLRLAQLVMTQETLYVSRRRGV